MRENAEKATKKKRESEKRARMATPGAMVLPSKLVCEYRATTRDVYGRNIDDETAELQARACSIQGSIAAIRYRLVWRFLRENPEYKSRVPWSIKNEVAYEDALFAGVPAPAELLQISAAEQPGAPGAPAAPPTAERVDSPISSDSMIGRCRE